MKVRLYIFDMGGVVVHHNDVFPDILNYLNITWEAFLKYAGDHLEKLYNGKVSTNEFWTQFSRRYGKEVKEELFGKFFHPSIDKEIVELIRRLKAHSKVVCGTNTFDPHYEYHLSYGHYAIFDAVFASNKIGLSKPDPEFFWYILKNEGVNPEEAYFVDDEEVNVLSAERLGINTTLFKDSKSLTLQIKI